MWLAYKPNFEASSANVKEAEKSMEPFASELKAAATSEKEMKMLRKKHGADYLKLLHSWTGSVNHEVLKMTRLVESCKKVVSSDKHEPAQKRAKKTAKKPTGGM